MNRRRFLTGALGTFFWLNFHAKLSASGFKSHPFQKVTAGRITGIVLQTAVGLEKMKAFYHESLGLKIISEKPDRITFQAGASLLTFQKTETEDTNPFYHFAFDIPENKIFAARAWQQERTDLITPYTHLQDDSMPDEIVHFKHWNAHSVFFFDPAMNIVEYIARHDIRNSSPGDFNSKDILYISEIAFVVDDVASHADEMKKSLDLKRYSQASAAFEAVGDQYGLLLVMKKGRAASFGQGPGMDIFPIQVSIRNNKKGPLIFDKLPYKIT